jgi:hypothetical protein
MRIALVGCTVFALAWTAEAFGQGAVLPPISPSKINAGRLRCVQYGMVAGRVVISSAYQGTNMTFGPEQVDRRQERLQIQINPEQINLRYELSGRDDRFSITLAERNQLSIRRASSQPKYSLHFEQHPDALLSLVVDAPDTKCTITAESFWHLYLAEPEVVRRHLVPLLEVLHPSWQLASLGAAIEESLVQLAQGSRQFVVRRWTSLVDDLASPQFATRQSAQRALFDAGPVVVPFLQKLDRSRLDAEQASRIRALVETLSVDYEDTTDRVATWLGGDVRVWLSLLSRGESLKRRTAKQQLDLLVGSPVDFDPDAEEAVRKSQIDRLRTHLLKPSAENAPPHP